MDKITIEDLLRLKQQLAQEEQPVTEITVISMSSLPDHVIVVSDKFFEQLKAYSNKHPDPNKLDKYSKGAPWT